MRTPDSVDLAPVAADTGPEQANDADALLMLAYARGDDGAFDRLYERHKGGSYRYFLRSVREPALAQELFQDLWLSLVRVRATYQVQARFTTWLYRMAHNRLIDHYRRSSVVELVALDADGNDVAAGESTACVADTAPHPDRLVAGRQAARHLLALVEALPAAQREAFLLQEEGGLSLEQIGEATGAGVETVKSRLRYAIARLRAGMKEHL